MVLKKPSDLTDITYNKKKVTENLFGVVPMRKRILNFKIRFFTCSRLLKEPKASVTLIILNIAWSAVCSAAVLALCYLSDPICIKDKMELHSTAGFIIYGSVLVIDQFVI